MRPHETYVTETAIRKVLADVWRAACVACRWEGQVRYDKARAERDGHEHTVSARAVDAQEKRIDAR